MITVTSDVVGFANGATEKKSQAQVCLCESCVHYMKTAHARRAA